MSPLKLPVLPADEHSIWNCIFWPARSADFPVRSNVKVRTLRDSSEP